MEGKNVRIPHGHFVGNGGQAIDIDGELVPRDLFELHLHREPYFGPTADPAVLMRLASFSLLSGLHVPEDLMAIKLTDLSSVSRGLGDCFLRALERYDWQFVTEPLPRTNECDPYIQLASGVPWVQVANRLRETIFVHQPSWERLSPQHKVAILIHEAVYSLLMPTAVDGKSFQQVGPEARLIAGNAFNAEVFGTDSSGRELFADSLNKLNVPREVGVIAKLECEFYPYRTRSGYEQLGCRVLSA